VNAPLQNLVGLIDARIEQLEAGAPAEPEMASDTEVSDAPVEAENQEA
jgi:hypothetical protein